MRERISETEENPNEKHYFLESDLPSKPTNLKLCRVFLCCGISLKRNQLERIEGLTRVVW